MILKDNAGKIIDKIIYTDNWYNDNDKKDGGYSLERINPNDTCTSQQANWSGANSVSVGGSPGSVNTIYSLSSDNSPPAISEISVVASNRIQVCFNEGMDSALICQINNYFIMSKKTKKGGAVSIKLTPKANDEASQVQELQMKKKLFEEKLSMFNS